MTLNVVLHLDPEVTCLMAQIISLLKQDRITPEEKRLLTAHLHKLQSKTSEVNRALQNQTGEEA